MTVHYDVEAVVREFANSGLLDQANVWARATIATLRTGRNYIPECLRLVGEGSRLSGKSFGDEALWMAAADTLGI